MSDKVLVVSVHPDDETLGCGGTLLRHFAAGDSLSWVVVTQAHEPQWSKEVIETKAREVDRVASAYGMSDVFRLGFPTVRLDVVPQGDLISSLREAIDSVGPDIVYCVHEGDIHSDHLMVFRALMSVLKPFYMAKLGVRRVLCYETLSSTEAAPSQVHRAFYPACFVDIGHHLERKIEIMAMYESELHSGNMPRASSSIRALARHRGATINVEYAEAFSLIREIM